MISCLLFDLFLEMIGLALIWSSTSMPEEQPLQTLTPFKFIFETENIILVGKLEKVKKFCRRFHHREWRVLVIVNDYWNPSIGIESQKPFFLLDIGIDVTDIVRQTTR